MSTNRKLKLKGVNTGRGVVDNPIISFAKENYSNAVDYISPSLTLKRRENRGLFNANEMDVYSNNGGITHLWMSEPIQQYRNLNISLSINLGKIDPINFRNLYFEIFYNDSWNFYGSWLNNFSYRQEGENYIIDIQINDTWTPLNQNDQYSSIVFKVQDVSTGWNSNYLNNVSFENIVISDVNNSHYVNNLWRNFKESDINIDNLISSIGNGSNANWNNLPMVPWGIIVNGNTPEMVGKEMIMLDVNERRFYKIKFLSWTQSNQGGGYSYTRQLIGSPITTTTTTEAPTTTTTTTSESNYLTFVKEDYGSQVDVISQYLTLKRRESKGLFNLNEGIDYDDTFFGGTDHLWVTEPLDPYRRPIGTYWIENLWNSFDVSTVDIQKLKEDILNAEEGSIDVNSLPMVPWGQVHGGNPPSMVDKEMIMLDVLDGKFYKIKFLSWTQGNQGGGYSYIRELIVPGETTTTTTTQQTWGVYDISSNTRITYYDGKGNSSSTPFFGQVNLLDNNLLSISGNFIAGKDLYYIDKDGFKQLIDFKFAINYETHKGGFFINYDPDRGGITIIKSKGETPSSLYVYDYTEPTTPLVWRVYDVAHSEIKSKSAADVQFLKNSGKLVCLGHLLQGKQLYYVDDLGYKQLINFDFELRSLNNVGKVNWSLYYVGGSISNIQVVDIVNNPESTYLYDYTDPVQDEFSGYLEVKDYLVEGSGIYLSSSQSTTTTTTEAPTTTTTTTIQSYQYSAILKDFNSYDYFIVASSEGNWIGQSTGNQGIIYSTSLTRPMLDSNGEWYSEATFETMIPLTDLVVTFMREGGFHNEVSNVSYIGYTTTTTTQYTPPIPVLYFESANYTGGDTWTDEVGNYNGAISNSVTYEDGAMLFNEYNDRVDVPSLPDSFWNGGSWTVSAWVKFNNLGKPLYSDSGIVGHGSMSSYQGLQIGERQAHPVFAFWNNDLVGNSVLSNGIWYNLTYCYNKDTGLKQIYVNGGFDSSDYGSYAGTGSNTMFGNEPFGDRKLDGYLNSIKLYDKALSAEDVRKLYADGMFTPSTTTTTTEEPTTTTTTTEEPTTTTTTTEAPIIAFTKANYGTDVDVVSNYLTLKRGDTQGLFNSSEMSVYGNYGGVNHLWCSEPITGTTVLKGRTVTIDGVGGENYWVNNLWSSWDSIKSNYNVSDISQAVSQNPTSVNNIMVPWEVVHENNPTMMVGKEMIMLDVQDGKFYKVKFTGWSGGNSGGGLSYTRQLIV